MLTSVLKIKEAIQKPLECTALTREVVGEPMAYPITAVVIIGNLSVAYVSASSTPSWWASVPPWWASASSAPPWGASVLPWWASASSVPPWWASVLPWWASASSAPPWLDSYSIFPPWIAIAWTGHYIPPGSSYAPPLERLEAAPSRGGTVTVTS